MSARYRSTCRHCWDPVDREGDEACAWCAMTPEQKRRTVRVHNAIAAVVLLGLLAVIVLAP